MLLDWMFLLTQQILSVRYDNTMANPIPCELVFDNVNSDTRHLISPQTQYGTDANHSSSGKGGGCHPRPTEGLRDGSIAGFMARMEDPSLPFFACQCLACFFFLSSNSPLSFGALLAVFFDIFSSLGRPFFLSLNIAFSPPPFSQRNPSNSNSLFPPSTCLIYAVVYSRMPLLILTAYGYCFSALPAHHCMPTLFTASRRPAFSPFPQPKPSPPRLNLRTTTTTSFHPTSSVHHTPIQCTPQSQRNVRGAEQLLSSHSVCIPRSPTSCQALLQSIQRQARAAPHGTVVVRGRHRDYRSHISHLQQWALTVSLSSFSILGK